MALDAATTGFLTQLAAAGGPALHEMEPVQAREVSAGLAQLFGPGPAMDRVEDLSAPGVDGSPLRVRLLVPDEPRGLIVYFHGGGWVIGAIDEFETLGRELAARTHAAVALVGYRLAPEFRHPTAAEDAWSALTWLAARRVELLGAEVPLIVAGDSAGGNLAAVIAQRATAQGGPAVALQVLVYPVTDCDTQTDTYLDPANQLLLGRDTMIWFWDHYEPDETRRVEPSASPLRAPDLRGLPPAVVLTAEHDVLRAEGESYAERLAEAGVDVHRRRFDGQMHGFFSMVGVLPGSAAAIDYVVDEIAPYLS